MAETQPSRLKRSARDVVGRLGRTGPGRRLLDAALKDDQNLAWFYRLLCDRMCVQASFDHGLPAGLRRPEGFEDLLWLFSSHALNQGLSRLELDEAAYLYRLA